MRGDDVIELDEHGELKEDEPERGRFYLYHDSHLFFSCCNVAHGGELQEAEAVNAGAAPKTWRGVGKWAARGLCFPYLKSILSTFIRRPRYLSMQPRRVHLQYRQPQPFRPACQRAYSIPDLLLPSLWPGFLRSFGQEQTRKEVVPHKETEQERPEDSPLTLDSTAGCFFSFILSAPSSLPFSSYYLVPVQVDAHERFALPDVSQLSRRLTFNYCLTASCTSSHSHHNWFV